MRELGKAPHAKVKTSCLFAIAKNDEKRELDTSVLREKVKAVRPEAKIEVYAGVIHRWCQPDSLVYNDGRTEQVWTPLLHLFSNALA